MFFIAKQMAKASMIIVADSPPPYTICEYNLNFSKDLKEKVRYVGYFISNKTFDLGDDTDLEKLIAEQLSKHALKVGDKFPAFELPDSKGKQISSLELLAKGPLVLSFYRGGWCPYCNAQLAGLKDIESKVMDLGYQIVAISPDSPARLKEQAVDSDFKVKLLSDKDFSVSSALGIGFFLPDDVANRYRNKMGIEFVALDGTSKVALPVPAVYIADQQGLVHFNYVNPNFRVRISPELLYQAAKTLDLQQQ